jgi:serine protease inhibitor
MVEHFKELGATHAFDYDKADFSGISSTSDSIRLERLYISKIIHKSFVEINEKETEACAFTFVVVNEDLCSSEEETRVFNCNRNFIFVIHVDKTYSLTHNNNNSILFFGKCARPN